MKKGKICSKLKRILITITCAVTLIFSMPVKVKAGIIDDFINLLLRIPDAIMWIGNRYIANTDEATDIKLDFKGWGGKGRIYNFDVSPYDIFSSGTEVERIVSNEIAIKDLKGQWEINRVAEVDDLVNSKLDGRSYSSYWEVEEEYYNDEYDISYTVKYKMYEYDIALSDIDANYDDTILYHDESKGVVVKNNRGGNILYHYSPITGYGYNYGRDGYDDEGMGNLAKIEVEVVINTGIDTTNDNATAIKLGLFDANFFRNDDVVDQYGYIVSSNILKSAIGKIYISLRNLCIILMMLVLLYIGIRIIISSAASDQSKYKRMLVDWLVGLCLLFIMHYIMSFSTNLNTIIVNMLSNDEGDSYYIAIAELQDRYTLENKDSTWLEIAMGHNPAGYTGSNGRREFFARKIIVEATNNDQVGFDIKSDGYVDVSTSNCIMYKNVTNDQIDFSQWGDNGKLYLSAALVNDGQTKYAGKAIYKASLMEFTRTLSSFALDDEDNVILYSNGKVKTISAESTSEESNEWIALGYTILYLALVIETIMFVVIYIKRVLQLAMLTMIAPLVSFMYPIDKVGDGQAQAYNTWLKDYIFNLLIQPLHLLLYTIFIRAASELFQKNIIYALAIYAFMIPAEKYFKKIFGFDKASGAPPGGFAGAMGGPLAMRGFDKLTGLGPHGHKGGSRGGDKDRNKLKINRNDIPKPTAPENGTPSPTSSGLESGGGLMGSGRTGSRGIGSGNTNNASGGSNPNSNKPSPTALGGRKGGTFGNLLRGVGNNLGKGFTRAVTGGKYNSLKGISGGAAAAAILGNGARKGANLGGRLLGTAALGTAGLVVGAASAIATGDVNNLSKGVLTGTVAGWSRGGELADWGSNKVGNFISDVDREWANIDEGHRAKYLENEARAQFQDVDLTDEQEAALAKYAQYVDFKGDEDKLDAYVKADELAHGDVYQATELVSLAKNYSDLNDSNVRDTAISKQIDEEMKYIDSGKIEVSDDEAKKLAEDEKRAELERIEKVQKETRAEDNRRLADETDMEERKKIRKERRDNYDRLEKEKEEAQKKVIDLDEVKNRIRGEKAIAEARARAKKKVENAASFQSKLK